jgi:hypothetical protein
MSREWEGTIRMKAMCMKGWEEETSWITSLIK